MVIIDSSNILFRSVFGVMNTFVKPFEGATFIYKGKEYVLNSDPENEEIEICVNEESEIISKEDFCLIWERNNVNQVITTFLLSLFKYKREFGVSYDNKIILAIDGKNCWRKKFFEENKDKMLELKNYKYKGDRSEKREDEKNINWNILFEVYDQLLETMNKYSDFIVLKVDGAEADDIIASIAKFENCNNKDEYIFIVSTDADFIQLTNNKIHLWSPTTKSFRVEEDPKKFLLQHILTGDKADNIPQIEKRLGDKTALKKIEEGLNEYLATDATLRERFEINKTLIDFTRIPKEITEKILTEYGSQFYIKFDQIEMTKFCWKHGLRKIVQDMKGFKSPKNCSDTELVLSIKKKPNLQKVMSDALFDFLSD